VAPPVPSRRAARARPRRPRRPRPRQHRRCIGAIRQRAV